MQVENKSTLQPEEAIAQLIVFRISDEEFGVPIDTVREIIKMSSITPIPKSPDFIRGIINVRGEIVTVIDLKARFSLQHSNMNISRQGSQGITEPKHIIVTKQNENLLGLMVDEVIEVLRVLKNEIKPSPSLITKINQKYITGVLTSTTNRLIVLLDLSLILSNEELKQMKKAVSKLHKEHKEES